MLIVQFLFSSCRNERKIEHEYLKEALKFENVGSEIKWVVILPGLGCNGCIQEGEAFLKEQYNDTKILFIVTRISSIKILQQKTGVKLDEHKNIKVDKENRFSIPSGNSIFPCIVYIMTNGDIKHEFQSPNNSKAFINLRKQLKQKE